MSKVKLSAKTLGFGKYKVNLFPYFAKVLLFLLLIVSSTKFFGANLPVWAASPSSLSEDVQHTSTGDYIATLSNNYVIDNLILNGNSNGAGSLTLTTAGSSYSLTIDQLQLSGPFELIVEAGITLNVTVASTTNGGTITIKDGGTIHFTDNFTTGGNGFDLTMEENSSLVVDQTFTFGGGPNTYDISGSIEANILNIGGSQTIDMTSTSSIDVTNNLDINWGLSIDGEGQVTAGSFSNGGYIFGNQASSLPDGITLNSGDFYMSGNYTVPAGVNSITVECWGAGGAGGGSSSNNQGGSGGGGGGYTTGVLAVTPGDIIPVVVGSGGTGVSGNDGNDGSATSFMTLTANGGTGGVRNKGAVGVGGTASGGTTNTTGDSGLIGTTSGGDGGDGANGGAGGAGVTNGNGNAGSLPGGGGGGGERNGGTNGSGGDGANGKVVIVATPDPSATIFYSQGSVDVGVLSNWDTDPSGGGTNPSNFTTAEQYFIIQNGHSMFTTGAWTISGTNSSVQITSGATLIANHAISATVYTNNGATFTHAIDGGTIPTGTWGSTSTLNITGITTTAPSGLAQDFGNVIWNCAAQSAAVNLGGNLTTINGNLEIQATNTGSTILAGTATTVNIAGNLVLSGGTLNMSSSGTVTLNLSGNYTQSGGNLTESGGIGSIVFAGTATQNFVKSSGTTSNDINYTVNSGAILNMSDNVMDGTSSDFTLSSGATLQSGHINGTSTTGNIQVGGTRTFDANANYEFNYSGAGAQNTGTGFTAGSYVTIDATNGAVLTSDATITNTLTLNSSFDATGRSLTLNGPSVAGTPTNLTTDNTTNLEFGGSSVSVTIPSSVTALNNLTIDNSNGVSLSNSPVLSGNLALDGGNIILGDYNISVSGSISSSAGFDNTHMIVTDGTGSLIKLGTGAANYEIIYPLGTGTYYTPVNITNIAAGAYSGNITIRAVAGRNPNLAFTYDGLLKYWVVSSSGITGITDAQLTFAYNAAEVIGSDAAYQPYIWDGSAFNTITSPTAAGSNPFGTNGAGNTELDGEWTAYDPVEKTTFYSYQNGDWDQATTWTLDPSGALWDNPSSEVPGTGDKAIIFSGTTVTMVGSVDLESITIEGSLDLAATTGHTIDNIAGSGTIRISTADNFPTYLTNTFFNTDEGTVEYYGTSFSLTTARDIYNMEINMDASNTLTFLATPYNIAGDLAITAGTFKINDDASTTKLRLTIENDIYIASGASFTVGEGNTLDGTETNVGNLEFYEVYHTLTCNGDFVNDGGTVRFTNQTQPVYNGFAGNGAVSLFMEGTSDNLLTCKGTTDLYNLVINKGSDKTYKVTLYSSAEANFRLYGRNNLGHNSNSPFTDENPEIRKALWVRNGTLEITGYTFIPSLTEEGGDYYVPANAMFWINGANVKVWNTDSTEPGADVGGIQGTGVYTNSDGAQSFSIYGDFKISDGYFTSGSHGIVMWYQPSVFGGILVEGGQCDVGGIRTATGSTAGKFSLTQTGGLIKFLGSYGREGLENKASLCILGDEPTLTLTGGTMEFYDGQTGDNDDADSDGGIIRIENDPSHTSVTGGTISIIRNSSNYNDQSIYSTAPFYNLTLTGDAASELDVNANTEITVLNNLTINDYAEFIANDNNLEIGGNFTLGATTTTNNAIYTDGNNTTTFTGAQNSVITVTNTNAAAPLSFNNLTINKTATASKATAWSVTLSSPGRTETAGDANNHILSIENDLLINEGKFNYYRYKVDLVGDYTSYGTGLGDATNTGRITLEGGDQYVLTGSTSSTTEFGDVELNDTDGMVLNTDGSFNGFILTSGIADIGDYNMEITSTDGIVNGNAVAFGTSKMIQTKGESGSQGITFNLSLSGTYTNQDIATIPVGVDGSVSGTVRYTPLVININGDVGVGPYTGTFNLRPVDEYHPTSDPTKLVDLLDFYWKTEVTGDLSNITASLVSYTFDGDPAFTLPGGGKDTWFRNNVWDEESPAADLEFLGYGFETTDYSVGKKNSYRTVQVLYSRNTGDWNTLSTWSLTDHDTDNAPAVLNDFDARVIGGSNTGSGTNLGNHQVTISADNAACTKLEILGESDTGIDDTNPPSVIINSGTTGHDFYNITGNGRFVLNDATMPSGDFNDFCLSDEAIFEYSGAGYTIPSDITVYPTLWITGNASSTKVLPNVDILVRKNLNIYDASNNGVTLELSSAATGDITINEDLVLTNQGKMVFPNGTENKNATILGDIDCTTGGDAIVNSIEVESGGVFSDTTHTLKIKGDINIGASTLTLWNSNAEKTVDLEFYGESSSTIVSSTSTNNINLSRLTINKSTDALSVVFEEEFSLNAPSNTSNKPLVLEQGILQIDNSATSLTLSSGTSNFEIPSTASLILNDGSLAITGNNIGLDLEGKLEINGGSVNVYDASSSNNYIQYYTTGNSELTITGGSLRVGSQIRRLTTTSGGILNYSQSGGTVEIGYKNAPTSNRGVFEVVNTGSAFSFTGGSLTIFRGQTSASVPSFNIDIDEADANIASGTTLNFGGASGSPQIGIYSSVPVHHVALSGTGAPTLKMWSAALEVNGDLDINSTSIFNTNGYNLTVGGDFTNSGSFIHSNNTTIFNGTGTQTITGATTFYNFTKQAAGTVELASSIKIDNDLAVSEGTISDNGNNIRVLGDVSNSGTLDYGGSDPATELGLFLNGTLQQQISGSGTFGKVTVENSSGVTLPVGSTILINDALRLNAGVFDIQGNLLALGLNCDIEGSGFDANKMIQTNTSFTDNGVKKTFPDGASTFTYPIGSLGKYTPVTFTTTANTSGNVGTITVKAANEIHPSITEDAEAVCELPDADNVLQYHWILKSENISGFTSTCTMQGETGDISISDPNGCGHTSADYITARLLSNSTTWNKYDAADFDEATATLSFDFSGVSSNIEGEYTAGLDDAIPNEVAQYISTGDGDWSTQATWDTYPTSGGSIPVGGPRGSITIISTGHTVNITSNNQLYNYRAQINGTLNLNSTTGHRLGDVTGTGTIKLVDIDKLPAGDYNVTDGFFTSSGGTLEYAGTSSYSVLPNLATINSVKFSGTGTRDLPNLDLTLYGDFTIEGNGGTVSVTNTQNRSISIMGDISMTDGTYDAGISTSKITFTGTNAQTITGDFTTSNSSDFYNIEVNKASGDVTIASAIEVSNVLTLTSGRIITSAANTLTLNDELTSVSGASSSSYVYGPLNKKIDHGSSFTFPVGNSAQFKQIGVSSAKNDPVSTTTPIIWTGEYLGANADLTFEAPLVEVSAYDRWKLASPTDATGAVTLYWNANSNLKSDAVIGNLRVAKLIGSTWKYTSDNGGTGDYLSGNVTSDDTVHFSEQEFTVGGTSSVLPVELTAFSGTAKSNGIELRWTTASELNNDYFEIQHCMDAENFVTIGKVYGNGTTMLESKYSYLDRNPENGTNYYRLVQFDYNGESEPHKTIAVYFDRAKLGMGDVNISVYPNPYKQGDLILNFDKLEPYKSVNISIVDMSGKAIVSAPLIIPESGKINLVPKMVDGLKQGIYMVNVQTNNAIFTKKVIVN